MYQLTRIPRLPRTALAASLGVLFAAPPLWAVDTPKPEVLEKKWLEEMIPRLGWIGGTLVLSGDGKTVTGWDNRIDNVHAVAWSGENWGKKTDLGALKSDNSGWSDVSALSTDGKIAAGRAWNDKEYSRAVVWSGTNWADKTDLGTLKSDNSGMSEVNALSADGKIAAGWAENDAGKDRAVVWSGTNWADKTDLGTLKSDNSGNSQVYALSANGKIVAGWADNDAGRSSAVVWSGESWADKTKLGTLKSDHSGSSRVNALSADGKIAAGGTSNDTDNGRAVVWSGENWADKTDLGTLKSDNSGNSAVNALSVDGKVAAGWTQSDTEYNVRAVVWSGKNWADKTDLGTLKSDNSGSSEVNALSSDGTVALGVAASDDGDAITLWRIRYANTTPAPVPPTQPTQPPQPSKPSTTAIHADNTRQTLVEMGKDTLAAVNMQQHALQRLHDTACTPTNGSKMCVRLQSDVSAHENKRDTAAGAALVYRFNDNWLAGVAFDRSLKRRLPDSYRSSGKGNHGVAVYGQWENNGWFIRPSAAWNDYRVRAVRPVLSGTEAGTGESRMKGQSYRLTFGQQSTQDKNRLTWYAGAEHSRVSRAAYTESNAEFPVRYADLRVRDTAVLMGAYSDVELSPSWSLLAGTEMARTVKAKAPEYDARAEYVGAFRYTGNKPKTRMLASAGVRYRLSPALSLSLLPYWERGAAGENRRGVRAGLAGEF